MDPHFQKIALYGNYQVQNDIPDLLRNDYFVLFSQYTYQMVQNTLYRFGHTVLLNLAVMCLLDSRFC